MHTLATRVYEKGPKSVADTIKEVEKLQAAQQLTATLLLSSFLNIMSTNHSAPLHWCCDMRPHSGPVLYTEGQVLNHPYRGSTVTPKTPSMMQLQTAYIIFAQ